MHRQTELLNTAVDIATNPDAIDIAYMARQLVQCTLPHSDPGDIRIWKRVNGSLTLAIRPYVDLDTEEVRYPYGTLPRLILFWVITEATQKKSRKLILGNSISAFMREIGLNPDTGGGKRGDAKRLHDQMERLFRSTITFQDARHGKRYTDMEIAPQGMLWWDVDHPTQDDLWNSWIKLSEDFYNAITTAPVPVDMRVLRALKQSPLALDIYAWATYTAANVQRKRKERIVPWDALHKQLGANYKDIRVFRHKVIQVINKIRLLYPLLDVSCSKAAITIHTSLPSIPQKTAGNQ